MSPSLPFSELSKPSLKFAEIFAWAKTHYRDRRFAKDELIPTRPGLFYLVEEGAVGIIGKSNLHIPSLNPGNESTDNDSEEVFLGLIAQGQPFEIISESPFKLQAYAHTEQTAVIWLYWEDIQEWPHLRQVLFDTFRYQHQRKLLWLSILGQKRSIDRLMGFLTLLVEEHGQPTTRGYYLPYSLTHSQIASAIGTTRVTITRLMGRLKQQGLIFVDEHNYIGLPSLFPLN
jgi:CRP-like cAMP-binding protein